VTVSHVESSALRPVAGQPLGSVRLHVSEFRPGRGNALYHGRDETGLVFGQRFYVERPIGTDRIRRRRGSDVHTGRRKFLLRELCIATWVDDSHEPAQKVERARLSERYFPIAEWTDLRRGRTGVHTGRTLTSHIPHLFLTQIGICFGGFVLMQNTVRFLLLYLQTDSFL